MLKKSLLKPLTFILDAGCCYTSYVTWSCSEMVALWALADVALVTSLREGVNLGAMEFVACQQTSMHGVLVYR